jgi:rod shape-determining protein MreD
MGSMTRLTARLGLVVISAAVLQVALFSPLPVAGARLPVLLLVAVAGGIALGAQRGAIVGFAAGLAFDLLLTTPLGLCAGVFAVAAHEAARFRPPPRTATRWRVPVTVAGISVVAYLAVLVAGWVLAQRPVTPHGLVTVLAVVATANAALAPAAVRVLRWAGCAEGRDRLFGMAHGR